jgi:hypothetical protein
LLPPFQSHSEWPAEYLFVRKIVSPYGAKQSFGLKRGFFFRMHIDFRAEESVSVRHGTEEARN